MIVFAMWESFLHSTFQPHDKMAQVTLGIHKVVIRLEMVSLQPQSFPFVPTT